MNHDGQQHLPEALRDRLAEEPPAERAELERVWHMLDSVELHDEETPASEDTWAAIQNRLLPDSGEGRHDRTPRSHMQRRTGRTWGAIAAGVLLLVLAGAFLWKQPVRVAAPAGEQASTTLPDGSTVELNSGTTLSHARRFSTWPFVPAARRVVRLQGEAFFDVQPGQRPFVVETFNARIEVVGTRFNVRARSDSAAGTTHVTLAEGRVRVQATAQPDDAVLLTEAGQSSRVTTATSPTRLETVGVDQALAWRRQGFSATDWPLTAIVAELERRYNLRITVRAPSVLADSMTLYYPQRTDAETILHDIAVAKGLTYRATSRGFELTAQ